MEDVDDKVKRLIYGGACAQVRAEPSFISSLNKEEQKIIESILGTEWKKLITSLSEEELEENFYKAYPNCPDMRVIGSKMIR